MKLPWWKYVLGELAFWGLVLFGSIIPMLWNAVSLIRYQEGDLGYLILSVCSCAIGAGIGVFALDRILVQSKAIVVAISAAVAATAHLVILLLNLILGIATVKSGISMGLVIIVLVVSTIKFAKEVS